jgi:hypothetical protein
MQTAASILSPCGKKVNTVSAATAVLAVLPVSFSGQAVTHLPLIELKLAAARADIIFREGAVS